ncbi:MAG: hypothetical protein ABFC88_12850 [Thermoguttaceae bacterium]
MARIELRDCDVFLEDGLDGAAAVNEPSTAPAEGDTSFNIDTVALNTDNTQKVPLGARFTIAGETVADAIHTVTARVQQAQSGVNEQQTVTLTNCTTTFTLSLGGKVTSAIAHDANAAAVKAALVALDDGYTTTDFDVTGAGPYVVAFQGALANRPLAAMVGAADTGSIAVERTRHGQSPVSGGQVTTEITFTPALGAGTYADGAVLSFLPQQLDIKVGEGNITYTEHNNYDYLMDRGNLDTVKEGDQVPMDVKLECVFEHITTGTNEYVSPMDALKKTGAASEWVNAAADKCEPYCVYVVVLHTPPCGGAEKERVTFPDFRSEQREINYKDATISITGKCKATEPIVEREAA